VALAASLAAACGGPPDGPTPVTVRVTAVAPSSGSTFGGTAVTISGEGFAAGASVVIGGAAASSVVLVNDRSITAVTPPHASGAADVVVSVAGRQGTLSGAFTFVAPTTGPNAPPVIQALRAQGARVNQPAGMADLNEVILVAATVVDTETAPESLIYEWAATLGAFQGTGSNNLWRAPGTLAQTPATAVLTLTVVERFVEAGAGGLPVNREHRVTRTIDVRVHDSPKEVAAMGKEFLENFSKNEVPPSTVVKDFLFTCDGGKGAAELGDVENVRANFVIQSYTIGNASPAPSVDFGGLCVLDPGSKFGNADACAFYPVRWVSREIATGDIEDTQGTNMVTAVYESRRWYLCHSFYLASDGKPARIKK
jgi:hypothetical protein